MSEQEQVKPSFMQELDQWSDENVIKPLYEAFKEDSEDLDQERFAEVRKAIRTKVLESYRNGQKAGPKPAYKPRKEFRR